MKLHTRIRLLRSAKIRIPARYIGRAAHRGDRERHVAAGGHARVLQGHHAARAARRARPGNRVCGVRARARVDREGEGRWGGRAV